MKRLDKIILLVIVVCVVCVSCYFAVPLTKDYFDKQEQKGKSVLDMYEKNHDMIGWIQIPGTKVSYPVMNSDEYLFKDINKNYDGGGTPFVLEGWRESDMSTIIYGHNMWMFGTKFAALHKFKNEEFFRKHQTINFYVVCGTDEKYVEKRVFKASYLIQTETYNWNYTKYAGIHESYQLKDFFKKCKEKSMYSCNNKNSGMALTLSTCSYHVSDHNGRLLLVGKLVKTELDDIIN